MSIAAPDVITRYFEADARRDVDAIVALFTDDAVVVDEGQTRRGIAEIKDWQVGAASRYEYTTEVAGIVAVGEDRYRATGSLEGNFPGGTADLKFDFKIAGERISELEIAP
jgi:ketosteroid isomerase-like protein